MRWLIYNIFFSIGYVLVLPKFIFRMLKRGGYGRGFMQRFGIYDRALIDKLNGRRRVWVHAVSVGEVYVALKYIDELREKYPDKGFVLTTNTSTGHAIARKKLKEEDVLLYFPVDFPFAVNRVLKIVDPEALIFTECEIWPNIIRAARKRGVGLVLINGRISGSSYAGYSRLKYFFAPVIRCFDLLLVQSEEDRDRLLSIGADGSRVTVTGSAKYDVARYDSASGNEAGRWMDEQGAGSGRLVLVGGSTWPGEEEVLLDIYARLRSEWRELRLVLVPRHAERRGEVIAMIQKKGFTYARRSDGDSTAHPPDEPDVLLFDTTGELMDVYARAEVIFVGKSLCSHGGQNIIEPALLSKPVICGPNMENFSEVMSDFLSEEAVIQVKDDTELEAAIRTFLADENARKEAGRKAGAAVEAKRGAVKKSVELIAGLLS